MAVKLPTFENTPLEKIQQEVERVRSAFYADKTRPVEFRLIQLRKLYWG